MHALSANININAVSLALEFPERATRGIRVSAHCSSKHPYLNPKLCSIEAACIYWSAACLQFRKYVWILAWLPALDSGKGWGFGMGMFINAVEKPPAELTLDKKTFVSIQKCCILQSWDMIYLLL